jgi:ferredoxin
MKRVHPRCFDAVPVKKWHHRTWKVRTMKLKVDRDKCVSLGICEGLAPDIFVLNDEGELEVDEMAVVPEGEWERVRSAVSGCPVNAITLIENE